MGRGIGGERQSTCTDVDVEVEEAEEAEEDRFMEDGRWKMEDGRRKMEGGRWIGDFE